MGYFCRHRMPWLIGLLLLLPALGAPADAAAAKKRTLTVTSVTSHARAGKATSGKRFRVTGVVRNRARRGTPALISITLRRTPHGRNLFAVGAHRLTRVRAGNRRSFRIDVIAPLVSRSRRFVVVACVRPRRGARSACLRAKRSVLVTAPAGGTGTGTGTNNGNGNGTGTGNGNGTGEPGAFTPGARSAGDRLFPQIGNGGYDATHYGLDLSYTADSELLGGTAAIDATATQNLSDYSLDFLDTLPITGVLVDGKPATYAQSAGKLIVTPPAGIPSGTRFTTTVSYAGTVAAFIDPDGSSEGWVPTSDGAFVVNEPVGAMSWFPSNNVPADKALYDLRVTVPGSREVLGNGRLASNTANADGTRTFHWRGAEPMASYLTTATNGEFDVTEDKSDPALPAYYGLDSSYTPVQKVAMLDRLKQSPAIVDFYEGFLRTAYPFDAVGGVVDKSSVGYALETQTKPMYANNSSADAASPLIDTISHELAHQWFGDSVSPATWSDIWLNEGPAEFLSWLWLERSGNNPLTTEQRFDTNYSNPAMSWDVPPAQPPTAADLFNTDAMYTRGAMVMEALREIMGEAKFQTVLASYQSRFRHGNASTAQFIALVKAGSGLNAARLDAFFDQWLYKSGRPSITPDNF